MSYGPREVGARVRYDAMGRVPSSSGLNPRSGLRRSTLALFVHSVRVEDLLLTKRHTLSGPV